MSTVTAPAATSSARLATALRAIGLVQLIVACTLVPSILIAWVDGDNGAHYFGEVFLLMVAIGAYLIYTTRGQRAELRLRDGFLVTSAVWLISAVLTPLPLMLGPPHLDYGRAMFEVVSGLTTTGATTVVGLDDLPRSVLFYRQSLHFLGGMGMIVLAVAVLPALRIGGSQLTRGESSGPNKDSKLTPRIRETAAALWIIYCGLTLLCTLAYWLAGMSWFDALTHAFSTTSTGGFANYDTSFAAFDSVTIEIVAQIFIILGATNFALHFIAFRRGSATIYPQDPEFRVFIGSLGVLTVIATLALWWSGTYSSFGESLRYGSFQVVSFATSTGFGSADLSPWPPALLGLFLVFAFLGACSGSTAGGLKTLRWMIVAKLARREMIKVIHPRGVFVVKIGDRVIAEPVLAAVAGFVTVYLGSYVVLSLLVTATGEDLLTAFSITAACITNLGPAMVGVAASTVQDLNEGAVWICTLAMLLGRLEVFTLLVLLTPAFWRE